MQQPTDTDSYETMELALQSGSGTSCDTRQVIICTRRWRFRSVREFDATKDRAKFMNDDGRASQGLT